MKIAKIIFFKCIHDSQEFGSNDEYMVSRVFFSLENDGIEKSYLFAQIKQPVGSSCNEKYVEVNFPEGITGPFNFNAFSDAAKAYYMRLIGARGCFINVGDSCSRIQTMNKSFHMAHEVEFNISDPSNGE